MATSICVYIDDALARYHFGNAHPFGPLRYPAFKDEFYRLGLDQLTDIREAVQGTDEQVLRFHTPAYLNKVKAFSKMGGGLLDGCDTPAFPGVYEASLIVVGTTLAALEQVITGQCRHAFTPIAGLHHARRDSAAGFCVFNDCGIAIETLKAQYQINKIAYVDIDAHHGDGVYYSFAADPAVVIVDIHEDGHTLYPGTGLRDETGINAAVGTKLNIPMPMGAGDEQFFQVWEQAEAFLTAAKPEVILLQCGADSLAFDPITHLQYSSAAHAYATKRLVELADTFSQGRLLVMGGGGYNLENIAVAWNSVIKTLL